MKKILSRSVGVAVLASGLLLGLSAMATTTTTTTYHFTPPTVNGACMQTATTARDNAMISAVGTYSTAVTSALSARRDAQNAAWGITDANSRKAALKTSQQTYSNSLKTARFNFKMARSATWQAFNNTAKQTCKTSPGSVTSTSDSSL